MVSTVTLYMHFTVTDDDFCRSTCTFFFWVNCYGDTLPLNLCEESKQCSGADGMQIQVKQKFLCSHLHGYN